MANPPAGADPTDTRRSAKKSTAPPLGLAHSPSDRLHLALVVALASVALIAIAFPLTRSAAGAEDPDSTPVLVVSGGFSAALRSQAETLVSAVTLGTPDPAARDAQSD